MLVIGIACTMSDWTPRLLRALAVDREVIIYDNAGIGQSVISAGQDPSAVDYFKFQADTLAGLISGLSLDQPDVLGWCSPGPPFNPQTQLIPLGHAHKMLGPTVLSVDCDGSVPLGIVYARCAHNLLPAQMFRCSGGFIAAVSLHIVRKTQVGACQQQHLTWYFLADLAVMWVCCPAGRWVPR